MDPFVDTTAIPIRDGGDTFWIKPRMDFGTRCRVEDTLTKMALNGNKGAGELAFTIGAQKLALAIHNIVRWEGPKFAAVPCTPENIERLDPEYPVFAKARDEIKRRNEDREATDPNGGMTTGGESSQESQVAPVVNGMSTSS